jgi:CheY-like chemotaxis protein
MPEKASYIELEQRIVELEGELRAVRENVPDGQQPEETMRERQRIANVLHEHIQQLLVAAKMQTSILVNRQSSELLTESARLVADLLDKCLIELRGLTAPRSRPVLQEGGLGSALQGLARSFFEKHGLKIEVSFDPSVEPLQEDVRGLLLDVSREVLFNIAKHSGTDKAQVECFRGEDNRVRVVITDEGTGFDPSRILAGEQSEGLGMPDIDQQLERLGGRLSIDSVPGKGTRITITGPLYPAGKTETHEPEEPHPTADQTHAIAKDGAIRVVVADDHHIVRQGLVTILRLEPDMDIVGEASNGAQAVNLARSLRPDIVVMDVSMPVLNGIEATMEIRRDFPEIQVIGLSMHDEGELSSSIRHAGAVAYVTKDGPPEALVAAMRKAAGRKTVSQ